MDEKMITITESEYNSLLRSEMRLSALECGGCDNWTFYGEALRDYRDSLSKEDRIIFDGYDIEDEDDY